MENSSDYLVKYRIKLVEHEIDLDEAIRIGEEVYHNGILVAYYIDGGFYSYSAYSGVSRGNFSNAFRIANIVSFLNPETDSSILFNYMDLLCSEMFDTDSFKIDRKIILKNINKVRDGLYDVSPLVKKYFWVKPYTGIGKDDKVIDDIAYDGKSKVVMNHYNKTKRIETISLIERSVNMLIEVGNDNGTFLTLNDISKESGVSISTVKRVSFLFKNDIDNYNVSNFNSYTYSEFLKNVSTYKITSAIRMFMDELEIKISQRKIAKKSNLHFNTVCNLWHNEYIQDALEEYNKWLSEYKKGV